MYNFYLNNSTSASRQLIYKAYRANETACVNNMLNHIKLTDEQEHNIKKLATKLTQQIRSKRIKRHGINAIMNEFKLTTDEGIALMCLAESLLRIPDKKTQDKLIKNQIVKGNWKDFTKTDNLFINATSWGLLITGKIVNSPDNDSMLNLLRKIVAKGSEPIIRKAIFSAVRLMGNQFVMNENIESALKIATKKESQGYRFSFDMLGESAITDTDAKTYLSRYIDAIHKVGKSANSNNIQQNHGISVKLSAIHPRYSRQKREQIMSELYPRLKQLYLFAKTYNIGLFIDAEDSNRLDISIDLLEQLVHDKDIQGFEGVGFVVQAYQKRAPYVIDYIAELARKTNTKIMVRLVKGAYWDSEIKLAQLDGQVDYPVYTRKFYTDVSYILCTQKLFEYQNEIYPLFATHNAYSLALVYELGKNKSFEFQCLYGMGEELYDNVVGATNLNKTCRIYAPVGNYDVLLSYLVRRLLENGANTSFVHQIVDKTISIDELTRNPVELAKIAQGLPNPNFSSPLRIYPNNRLNSKGMDLSDELTLEKLDQQLNILSKKQYLAYPLIAGVEFLQTNKNLAVNPANTSDIIGEVIYATDNDLKAAISNASNRLNLWSKLEISERAGILLKMAELLEENYIELMGLLVREAGKTINNAINEIREAIDFCRYYANQAKLEFNQSNYAPLGIIACISPWNFPLAIFIGEISSALVMGNSVIAKPSNQTNIIAFYVVSLFYQAGVPEQALQLVLGSGSKLGDPLTCSPQINGVIFTGSTATAQRINKNLATKTANNVLIAETGGQNTMIVDSSALTEQVVNDVISSGFDSAGQRCSALRVLYLQADIADKIITMIKGAMDELRVGNPSDFATDVGPIIDKNAQQELLKHINAMKAQARYIYQSKLQPECTNGYFVPPTIIEIGNINELKQEVFGPIIHIIRYANSELEQIIAEINSTGYGLTQGVHSRINSNTQLIYKKIRAGNIYVNRNMVGAVVGVQPFGGEGLSGTGPKAGGQLYLYRLAHTKTNPQLGKLENKRTSKDLNILINSLSIFSPKDKQTLLDYAKLVTKDALIQKTINLAGPTGEDNFVYFDNRGFIGCFANTAFDYAKQIICALVTENKIILPFNDITKPFNSIISSDIFFCEQIEDIEELHAVLISRDYTHTKELKTKLANRDGLLVINIVEQENETGTFYPIYLLNTEKSISINITATGGNVQLLNLNDRVE